MWMNEWSFVNGIIKTAFLDGHSQYHSCEWPSVKPQISEEMTWLNESRFVYKKRIVIRSTRTNGHLFLPEATHSYKTSEWPFVLVKRITIRFCKTNRDSFDHVVFSQPGSSSGPRYTGAWPQSGALGSELPNSHSQNSSHFHRAVCIGGSRIAWPLPCRGLIFFQGALPENESSHVKKKCPSFQPGRLSPNTAFSDHGGRGWSNLLNARWQSQCAT